MLFDVISTTCREISHAIQNPLLENQSDLDWLPWAPFSLKNNTRSNKNTSTAFVCAIKYGKSLGNRKFLARRIARRDQHIDARLSTGSFYTLQRDVELAEIVRAGFLFVQKEKGFHGLNSQERKALEGKSPDLLKEGREYYVTALLGFSTLVFLKHVVVSFLLLKKWCGTAKLNC